MTERGRRSLTRDATRFVVGPSSLVWNGRWFELTFDERGCPWPSRVRGRVRIHPSAFTGYRASLDERGLHRWGPLAPCSRVEVEMADGGPKWKGHGYLDSNEGDEPIHIPFTRWDWSRSTDESAATSVIYDVQCKSGMNRLLAQRFKPDGSHESFEAPVRQPLPRTAWGIERTTRSDAGVPARVVQVFENAPFYVRDLVAASIDGRAGLAVHESLDALRLASWPMRFMLPFRMPRRS